MWRTPTNSAAYAGMHCEAFRPEFKNLVLEAAKGTIQACGQ